MSLTRRFLSGRLRLTGLDLPLDEAHRTRRGARVAGVDEHRDVLGALVGLGEQGVELVVEQICGTDARESCSRMVSSIPSGSSAGPVEVGGLASVAGEVVDDRVALGSRAAHVLAPALDVGLRGWPRSSMQRADVVDRETIALDEQVADATRIVGRAHQIDALTARLRPRSRRSPTRYAILRSPGLPSRAALAVAIESSGLQSGLAMCGRPQHAQSNMRQGCHHRLVSVTDRFLDCRHAGVAAGGRP